MTVGKINGIVRRTDKGGRSFICRGCSCPIETDCQSVEFETFCKVFDQQWKQTYPLYNPNEPVAVGELRYGPISVVPWCLRALIWCKVRVEENEYIYLNGTNWTQEFRNGNLQTPQPNYILRIAQGLFCDDEDGDGDPDYVRMYSERDEVGILDAHPEVNDVPINWGCINYHPATSIHADTTLLSWHEFHIDFYDAVENMILGSVPPGVNAVLGLYADLYNWSYTNVRQGKQNSSTGQKYWGLIDQRWHKIAPAKAWCTATLITNYKYGNSITRCRADGVPDDFCTLRP